MTRKINHAGNIQLGGFCKAILENKPVRIYGIQNYSEDYDVIYNYEPKYNIYVGNYSDYSIFKPEELIARYIDSIYNLIYTFEIIA